MELSRVTTSEDVDEWMWMLKSSYTPGGWTAAWGLGRFGRLSSTCTLVAAVHSEHKRQLWQEGWYERDLARQVPQGSV